MTNTTNHRPKIDLIQFFKYICLLTACLAALYTFYDLFMDYQKGGNNWKQGDWLINSFETPIRRAMIGNLILKSSDIFGINPLILTVGLQFVLFTLILLSLAICVRRIQTPAIWILILSPAFFLIFWAADTKGSMRKELIIYLSMLLIILGYIFQKYKTFLILASITTFVIGVFSHEGLALFFPIYAVLLMHLAIVTKIPNRYYILYISIAAVAAVGSIFYAINHSSISNISQICTPLTDRGLNENICGAAIDWLSKSLGEHISQSQSLAFKQKPLFLIITLIATVIGPIYIISCVNKPRLIFMVYTLCFAPFLPLFYLGIDWGRWVNFYFSSATFIFMFFLITKTVSFRTPPRTAYVIAFTLSNYLWSMGHTDLFSIDGIIVKAIDFIV